MQSSSALISIVILGLIYESAAQWVGNCDINAAAQDHYDQPPVHSIQCTDEAQNTFDLDFEDASHHMADIFAGDKANVTGEFQNGKLRVHSYNRHSREFQAGRGEGMGMGNGGHNKAVTTRRAVVIILRIVKSDGTYVSGTSDLTTISTTVNNTIFGVYSPSVKPTLAGLWDSCSHGQLELAFDVDNKVNMLANTGADIFTVDIPFSCTGTSSDPYCTMPYNSATCTSSENYGWPTYAMNKLAATQGFVKSTWQHQVLIYPSGSGEMGCKFVGMGSIGCTSSYCYSWISSAYAGEPQNFAHEMGHNLGLPHSGSALATSGTSDREYGDFSCAMGFCCLKRCYNAPHMVQLGWMSPSATVNSANFPANSPTTFSLASMTRSTTGTIKITTDWLSSGSTTYWLQYKIAEHYDFFLTTSSSGIPFANSVGIKQWNMGSYENSLHLSNLVVGGIWTDPSGTLTVQVQSLDSNGGVASVIITRIGASSTVASATPSPAPQSPSSSATQSASSSRAASPSPVASPSASSTRTANLTPSTPTPSPSAAASPSASATRAAPSPTPSATRAAASPTPSPTRAAASPTPSPTRAAPSPSPSASPTHHATCGTIPSGQQCITSSMCSSCSCLYNSSKSKFLCA